MVGTEGQAWDNMGHTQGAHRIPVPRVYCHIPQRGGSCPNHGVVATVEEFHQEMEGVGRVEDITYVDCPLMEGGKGREEEDMYGEVSLTFRKYVSVAII